MNQKEPERNKQQNKKKRGGVVYRIIMAICIAVILYAGFNIVKIVKNHRDADRMYSELKSEVTASEPVKQEEQEKPQGWYTMCGVDFDTLRSLSDQAAGWLYMENSDIISYPVMYSGDNSYWLRRGINGKYAIAGSIFIEGRNHPDLRDMHTIIYGHRMRVSMFGTLSRYKDQTDYYESGHQYFQLITPEAAYRYLIFGWRDVSVSDDIYTLYYDKGDDYTSFVQKQKDKSMRDTGVDVSGDDHVVTLSTCSKTSDRFTVNGKLVSAYIYATGEELDRQAANDYLARE